MKWKDNTKWTSFDNGKDANGEDKESDFKYSPADSNTDRALPIKLVNHEIAQKFFASAYNIPWVKQPVCYLEDRDVCIVYDPLNSPVKTAGPNEKALQITYIKRPMPFVKELPAEVPANAYVSYFDYDREHIAGNTPWNGGDKDETGNPTYEERYEFECNSTVAEELISLAVAFALENVESQRLNSKLNMRGLEA